MYINANEDNTTLFNCHCKNFVDSELLGFIRYIHAQTFFSFVMVLRTHEL